MSKEIDKKLIEKYLDVESSLEEEKTLFDAQHRNPDLQSWATYVKETKKEAPGHLMDSIWQTIEKRRKRTQRFIFGIPAAAAAIALLVTFSVNNSNHSISDEEKKVLLNEALSMFQDDPQIDEQKSIIYEDEKIIIYITENK